MSNINKIRKDGVDYDISSSEVYSTEEQEIGTWIDGKPLYRKVLNIGDCSADSEILKETNISNIDKVTKLYGTSIWTSALNKVYTMPIPYISKESNQRIQAFYLQTDNKIGVGSNISITDIYVVMEYTKTTD